MKNIKFEVGKTAVASIALLFAMFALFAFVALILYLMEVLPPYIGGFMTVVLMIAVISITFSVLIYIVKSKK